MKHVDYDLVEFKATTDGPDRGLFAAIVSVFGNVDRTGDRMMKGAFAKSIDRWRKSGKKIPVIFSHEWKDPSAFIGVVDPQHMRETDQGLVVSGRLDIADNPKAMQVYRKLQDGTLSGWSFGYEVKDERLGKDSARELLEVELFEVGPTLLGANPEAATLAVKEAAVQEETEPEPEVKTVAPMLTETVTSVVAWTPEIEAKIGRAMSSKREAELRAIHKRLSEFLAEFNSEELDDAEGASSTPETKEPVFGEKELLQRDIDEATVFVAERSA